MQIARRMLKFGSYTLTAEDAAQVTPYILAGQRVFMIGLSDGEIQPIGDEHLVGEMGGLWIHPLKVAAGLTIELFDAQGTPMQPEAGEFTEALSHVEWRWPVGTLELVRRECAHETRPAYLALISLANGGDRRMRGQIRMSVALKFLGCWFGGLADGPDHYWLEDGIVLGYDQRWQDRWGIALGGNVAPTSAELRPGDGGQIVTMAHHFVLDPGDEQRWELWLAASHDQGHTAARALLDQLILSGEQVISEKSAHYERLIRRGVSLDTPDHDVNRGFALACANFQLLRAHYPDLPAYFLAGLPEFPQLFGCDTEYSVPGAAAAGFAPTIKSALLALAAFGSRACGRVPHEVTTNGRIFHPGNTQETPQFAMACWDYVRWTGDLEFLRAAYPLCREGVSDYLPALWHGRGRLYPIGDGVVERLGMGARKLDSTCYLFGALQALRQMAEALHLAEDAEHYAASADHLHERFEEDWWLEAEGLYADSLHTDLEPQLDGHWTVVLPVQLGMAAPARAGRVLERIRREWCNQWGLVHTRDSDERVWTLPTGLLALAACRQSDPDWALQLLKNIALTTSYGTLGTFKELIPQGLCFVQLWSAALYIQGMIEGLLGINPSAHESAITIRPSLPTAWKQVRLRALPVGKHELDLRITTRGLTLAQTSGPRPLLLRYPLPPDSGEIDGDSRDYLTELNGERVVLVRVAPGQRAIIEATSEAVKVEVG